MFSHVFVASEKLEGSHYLNFISEHKKSNLGSEFIKLDKKRIRKRSLSNFLKKFIFSSPVLEFERKQVIKNYIFKLLGKGKFGDDKIDHNFSVLFLSYYQMKFKY